MRLAIMQPYFLPYPGYFQLAAAVDRFVVYDDVEFTRRGWIHRNRFLKGGEPAWFSLPLKKASDFLPIGQRELADTFRRQDLLNQFRGVYAGAPHFSETFAFLQDVLACAETNLFRFLLHGLLKAFRHLGIETEMVVSSTVSLGQGLRGEDRVLALCRILGADVYVNPPGGTDLYHRERFRAEGVELRFLRPQPLAYPQFGKPFVPMLSVVDPLMFLHLEEVRTHVATRFGFF